MYFGLAGFFTVTEMQLLFPVGDTFKFDLTIYNSLDGTGEPYVTIMVRGCAASRSGLMAGLSRLLPCAALYCTVWADHAPAYQGNMPIIHRGASGTCAQPLALPRRETNLAFWQTTAPSNGEALRARASRTSGGRCSHNFQGRGITKTLPSPPPVVWQDLESEDIAEWQPFDLTGYATQLVTSIGIEIKGTGSGAPGFALLDANILGTQTANPTDTVYVSMNRHKIFVAPSTARSCLSGRIPAEAFLGTVLQPGKISPPFLSPPRLAVLNATEGGIHHDRLLGGRRLPRLCGGGHR